MPRERITITLDDDLLDDVEDFETEHDHANRSEAIRELLGRGLDRDDVVEQLEAEINRLEARLEEQERRERERDRVEQRVDELAIELREQRERRDAPFPVRWWRWWRSRDEN